jgi:hypothetical protein
MPPMGFEPTIPVSERPKTHALDRADTGIGIHCDHCLHIKVEESSVTMQQLKNNNHGIQQGNEFTNP